MAGQKHTGIIDAEKSRFLTTIEENEHRWQEAADYVSQQEAHNIWSIKGYINTVDNIVRLGRPMSWQDLEKKMAELPNGDHLVFREHSCRPFRAAYFRLPTGEELSISAYGKSVVLPEFSTMEKSVEMVPDLGVRHLNHLDFPSLERYRWDAEHGYIKPEGLNPGYRVQEKLWGENPEDINSRGWRTVLCRWITQGLRYGFPFPSPDLIERKFGAADSPLWANHTGKRNERLPF